MPIENFYILKLLLACCQCKCKQSNFCISSSKLKDEISNKQRIHENESNQTLYITAIHQENDIEIARNYPYELSFSNESSLILDKHKESFTQITTHGCILRCTETAKNFGFK